MKPSGLTVTPFEGLDEVLKRKARKPNGPGGKRKAKHNPVLPSAEAPEDAEEIFRKAMSGVREIREYRDLPLKEPPGHMRRPAEQDDSMQALRELIEGRGKITLSDTDEYMEWRSPGVSRSLSRRLHRGDLSVQDSLDLHGLTLKEAEVTVEAFMREARARGLSCVKVIHGRGLRSPHGPVLKKAVAGWLRRHSVAYTTARGCDGGLGATYAVLKSR